MDKVTKGMPRVEEERGGMEWHKPCILKGIHRVYKHKVEGLEIKKELWL
jgi:hypothetical protein